MRAIKIVTIIAVYLYFVTNASNKTGFTTPLDYSFSGSFERDDLSPKQTVQCEHIKISLLLDKFDNSTHPNALVICELNQRTFQIVKFLGKGAHGAVFLAVFNSQLRKYIYSK